MASKKKIELHQGTKLGFKNQRHFSMSIPETKNLRPSKLEKETKLSTRRISDVSDERPIKLTNSLIEELEIKEVDTKCPQHIEEDLEFYSFTKNKMLCSECLVSGDFFGQDVVNVKRAGERIKSKLKEIAMEMKGRTEDYAQWEKLIDSKRQEFIQIFEKHQDQIRQGFSELRKKIEEKERDLLEDVDKLKAKKELEAENLGLMITNRSKEINTIKEFLENVMSNTNNSSLCFFFSKKNDVITKFLKEEDTFREQNSGISLKGAAMKDNQEISGKLNEALKKVKEQLDLVPGLVEIQQIETVPTELASEKTVDNVLRNLTSQFRSARNAPKTHFDSVMSSIFQKDLGNKRNSLAVSSGRNASNLESSEQKENISSKTIVNSNSLFEKYFNQINNIRNFRNQSFNDKTQGSLLVPSQETLISDRKHKNNSEKDKVVTSFQENFMKGTLSSPLVSPRQNSRETNQNVIKSPISSIYDSFVAKGSPGNSSFGTKLLSNPKNRETRFKTLWS